MTTPSTLNELTLSAPLLIGEAGGKTCLIRLLKTISSLVLDGFSLSAPYTRSATTPSSLARETSKTAKASDLLPQIPLPLRQSLRLQMKHNPTLYGTDSRFLNSPVEEEEEEAEEEEVGFRPLRVKGRPMDM